MEALRKTDPDYLGDLKKVFGEEGSTRLIERIAQDEPTMNPAELALWAWSLIPDATAYMQPAEQEDLVGNAITIYEHYASLRKQIGLS